MTARPPPITPSASADRAPVLLTSTTSLLCQRDVRVSRICHAPSAPAGFMTRAQSRWVERQWRMKREEAGARLFGQSLHPAAGRSRTTNSTTTTRAGPRVHHHHYTTGGGGVGRSQMESGPRDISASQLTNRVDGLSARMIHVCAHTSEYLTCEAARPFTRSGGPALWRQDWVRLRAPDRYSVNAESREIILGLLPSH